MLTNIAMALTVGDGIALCGGMASVVAVVVMLMRRGKAANVSIYDKLEVPLQNICVSVAELSKHKPDAQECMAVLAEAAKDVAEQINLSHRKFEDVVRLSAEMANLKANYDNLQTRYDKLYDIVQEILRMNNGRNNS